MRILFSAIPGYGHVLPLIPLAEAAMRIGHEAVIATGEPLLGRLSVPSVRGYPPGTLTDAEEQAMRRHPELATLPPDQRFRIGLELFADIAFEAMRTSVRRLIVDYQPSLVVYEAMAVGAAAAARENGVPTVAVGIGQWSWFPELLHRTVAERNGLDQPHSVLADAYVEVFPPSTWSHDRTGLPATHLLRPTPASIPGSAVPDWLLAEGERPRVYLTLGTVSFGATEALEAALDVLDDRDVDVLVAVGPEGDPSALRARSSRVHVERFVDQAAVLPRVDAVVHHGGTGTLLAAFAAALPQVLMPQGADQFMNAELMATTGAGRAFFPDMPPGALASAIDDALGNDATRAAARGVAHEVAAMPLPDEVAALLATVADN